MKKLLSLLLSACFGVGALPSLSAQNRLPGMEQQIEVQNAKELGITAPSGEAVAVLDQSKGVEVDGASMVQDHHNGWLHLSTDHVEGNVITVKGKYYIPSSAQTVANSIRFTVRKRSPEGLTVYVDKALPLEAAVDDWIDFEIELPLDESKEVLPERKYVLMLSAQPFAGPVYLDNVQVLDPQDNQLWDYPEFE